jgi:hypothetical protein
MCRELDMGYMRMDTGNSWVGQVRDTVCPSSSILSMVEPIFYRAPCVYVHSLTTDWFSFLSHLATSGAMEESLGRKEKRKKDSSKHKDTGDRRDECVIPFNLFIF